VQARLRRSAGRPPKIVLRFRHVDGGRAELENALWFGNLMAGRQPPKNAPAFSACVAVQASAEKCSCIFGVPAIHGHKKRAA
jgi:hypothetical protein